MVTNVVLAVPPERLFFLVLLIAVFVIGPAYLSGYLARQKGYSFALFFVLGLVFSIFPLLVLLALPRRS